MSDQLINCYFFFDHKAKLQSSKESSSLRKEDSESKRPKTNSSEDIREEDEQQEADTVDQSVNAPIPTKKPLKYSRTNKQTGIPQPIPLPDTYPLRVEDALALNSLYGLDRNAFVRYKYIKITELSE